MITYKKILSGGVLFILLASTTLAQAQRYTVNYEQEDGQVYSKTIDTQNKSAQGYTPQNQASRNYAPQSYGSQSYGSQNYAPKGYAPQSYGSQAYAPQNYVPQNYMPRAAQRSIRQGTNYIQNYLPKTQMLPKTQSQSPAELLKNSINKVIYFLAQPKEKFSDRKSVV